jgi:hypothetical protein
MIGALSSYERKAYTTQETLLGCGTELTNMLDRRAHSGSNLHINTDM